MKRDRETSSDAIFVTGELGGSLTGKHLEFIPKLTNTAGFEWSTGFYINPTPPEESAKFLREAEVSADIERVK